MDVVSIFTFASIRPRVNGEHTQEKQRVESRLMTFNVLLLVALVILLCYLFVFLSLSWYRRDT